MRDRATAAFRWLSAALFVLCVATVAVAGLGAFDAFHRAGGGSITKKVISSGYGLHIALGSATVLAMLLLLIVAAWGHLGPKPIRWAATLAVLGIVQAVLGSGESVPVLGILHGLGAAAIIVLAGALAHRTWTDRPTEPT